MKYKTIYHFMVMDEVEKGETVYCLDRLEKEVLIVNDLTFDYALRLLRDAKDNDRYEFWVEVTESDG